MFFERSLLMQVLMEGSSFLLSGAPLVGKSSTVRELIKLTRGRAKPVLVNDNEIGFSMPMRCKIAGVTGMTLNSPEFVKAFNFQGQLDYQAACRFYAGQGFDVVMPSPSEDLTPLIPVGEDKIPLLKKMQIDFGGRIKFFQLVLLPEGVELNADNVVGHPAMAPIEAEIQRRREARGEGNPFQQQLDADKTHATYYSERLRKQFLSYEMFPDEITQVRATLSDTPAHIAQKLCTAMFPT
jgi:hypothetical protein